MTTQPFPGNKVVLFGQIDQWSQSRRDEQKGKAPEPAIRRFRNTVNGDAYLVQLQVAAPYGGSYQLEVEVGRVEGAELFRSATAGQSIVLEGHLRRTSDEDERFRNYAADQASQIEGIVYQEVMLQVERVRAATEHDPQGTGSNVFLEGTVVEPPVFIRHPDSPEIELARVTLRARTTPTLSEAGLVIPGRPCDVTVIIPTEDEEAAAYLSRRGNRVRVRGVIDRLSMRQFRRNEVQQRLAELDQTWRTTRDEIRGPAAPAPVADGAGVPVARVDPDALKKELAREGKRYLRERERLAHGTRTMVLAVAVTPLEGAMPASRAEALEDRERYDQEYEIARAARRQERKERQRRNRQHEQAARAAADAEGAPAELPPSPTARRPRRHSAERPTDAAIAEAPVEAAPEEIAPPVMDILGPQVDAALAAVHTNGITVEG